MRVDELKADVGAGPGNGNDEVSKVTFLPEQQAKVQELIDEAYRKAYTKASRAKSSSEEVERLKGEVERLKEERKTAAVLRAVAKHSVVDAEEVAELLKSRVQIDEQGGISVAGPSGGAMVNGYGQPMALDEFVDQWLSERPHHLRTSGTTGAGSLSSRFGGASQRYNLTDPSVWRSMPRTDLDRMLKEGISVHGAAGQSYRFKDVKNPFVEARRRKTQGASDARRNF